MRLRSFSPGSVAVSNRLRLRITDRAFSRTPVAFLIVCAVLLAVASAGARADAGFAESPNDYDAAHNSSGQLAPVFGDLKSATGSGANWTYVRFTANWDIAGTLVNGSCTPLSSTNLQQLVWAMYYAEHTDGVTPVLAIYPSHVQPGDPDYPTDAQYKCGLGELFSALTSPASSPWNISVPSGGVWPGYLWLETLNEPWPWETGSPCEPGANWSSSRCAASYYNDAHLEVLNWNGGQIEYEVGLIAGVFMSASSGSEGGTSLSDEVANPGNGCTANNDTGFDYCYALWLTSSPSNQSTPGFGLHPHHWSFHDYHDVQLSSNCEQVGGSGCSTLEAQNFKNMLATPSFGITSPDIWVTEAGGELNGNVCGGCLDGNTQAQADAAEGWLNLLYSGYINHLFWYEGQTYTANGQHATDDFDSALIGIDQVDNSAQTPQQSSNGQWYGSAGTLAYNPLNSSWSGSGAAVPQADYCVLAFNERPSVALSDNRCDYTANPGVPWTDWQGDGQTGLGGQPGAAADSSDGWLNVFWQGTDGGLWEGASPDGTSQWGGPYDEGWALTLGSPPAAARVNGQAWVVWEGTDGALWEGYWNGSSWSGPTSLGAAPLGSYPTIAAQPGEIWVFWRGTDSGLWEDYWNGYWHGAYNVGYTGELASPPAIAENSSNGQVFAYWKGNDGHLWEAYWNDYAWQGPYDLSWTGTLASPPTVAVNSQNHQQYVFWQGTNGDLWEASLVGNTWQGPYDESWAGSIGSTPSATVNSSNGYEFVFWEGRDGHLWEGYWNGSGWTLAEIGVVGPLIPTRSGSGSLGLPNRVIATGLSQPSPTPSTLHPGTMLMHPVRGAPPARAGSRRYQIANRRPSAPREPVTLSHRF